MVEADDERLLELLAQALAPERADPSPERVAAVRRPAEQGSNPASRPAGQVFASRPAGQVFASRPAGQVFASRPAGQASNWSRRVGWLAAGVSVAAAALVIAMLALPTLVGSGRAEGPAVARLRGALTSGNPVAVARADANLLRQSDTIAVPDRDDAVAAHVEAIQFLRDHPSAGAAAELPPAPTVPPRDPFPVPTTTVPAGDPAPETVTPPAVAATVPVPTTVAAGPLGVTIRAVVARLDGTFAVDFDVSGFTPDASGAPGTHSVRFSFDDGQSPVTWSGPSPWSFPVGAGLSYRQVCAHVADSAGVEDRSTGGCHNIV